MGRHPEFDLKVVVRVTEDLPVRIRAVLRPGENVAEFFRTLAWREVKRRELAAEKRKETAPGRRAHA